MYNTGSPTLIDVTFSGNIAKGDGGGAYNSGSPTLTNVTFRDNLAYNGGGMHNTGNPTLTNSIFDSNRAFAPSYYPGFGGGLYNLSGSAALTNVTISENEARPSPRHQDPKGGGMYNWSGSVEITQTIIAGNVGGDCWGAIVSQGYNLDGDGTCNLTATGDIPNTDPLLGPLQDNGGPTKTHALLACSPAIDGITDPEKCTVDTDQRGVTRPQGTFCDIAAYEYEFEVALPDLWAVEYRWGGYSFDEWPIFVGWMNVRIESRSDFAAYNVCARVTDWPANTEVPDAIVFLGDILAGEWAWSRKPDPTFTTRVDMDHPADHCEGVLWRIEYDDAAGVHHVIENVPEFPPGEGPPPCP